MSPHQAPNERFAPTRIALVVLCCFFLFGTGARANPFAAVAWYAWDRTTDLLDIVRCGVAVGPSAGAEVAVTDRLQLGAYAAAEGGLTFPHVFPPLWPLTGLDGKPVLDVHEGRYGTSVFGSRRRETSLRRSVRFPRSPYEVRGQLAAGIVHGYVSVNLLEIGDFLVGIVGRDPMRDDSTSEP